ncbi:MAG: IPT/TIG domain-containing protein [Acidimicrobiales bacterium]
MTSPRAAAWRLLVPNLRPRLWLAVALAACLAAGALASLQGVGAATAPMPDGPVIPLFGQQWQPWGSQDLGTSTSTIGSDGCALTASAMLLEAFGVSTNPGTLNQWLVANGGYVDQNLLVWGAVAAYAKAQGAAVTYSGWLSYNLSAIDSSLAQGDPVIAQVTLDGSMHFVLLTGTGSQGTLWMNDPWFGDHTTFQSRYGSPATGIQSIRLYTGTPAQSSQLTAMSPGGSETITAPQGGFGPGLSGSQVLVLPYTTSSANWLLGTPVAVSSWTAGQISFTAPTALSAGSVIVETSTAQPNFWFSYTLPGAVALGAISPNSGPAAGGTTVTITGTGFQMPAEVTFGGQPATSVNVVGPTEIQAVSPPGAGNQYVQVGDWMGTSPDGPAAVFSYPVSQPPGALVPITPARICDTRPGNPSGLTGAADQCLGHTLVAGSPLDIQVSGVGGVPTSGVTAAVLNVTVTDTAAAGFLTVYPAGGPAPGTSNIDFSAGETVANQVQVGLSQGGQVAVVASAAADVVVDVDGYFASPAPTGSGLLQPLTPSRICDTRPGNPSDLSGGATQCGGKTLAAGDTLQVQVTGLGGVPTGAQAAMLNVTATDTTRAGFLTVFPGGPLPTASSLNWAAGGTVPNLVLAPLSAAGTVSVYNALGSTDVVIDVLGYYAPSATGGSQFTPASSPVRICDTRPGQPQNPCTGQTLGPGGTLTVPVAGQDGVPVTAVAVVVNVAVTDTTAASYLSAFPSGTPTVTSNLNWAPGQTVSNLVLATLSATGGFTVYNCSGAADVVVDVLGWYS